MPQGKFYPMCCIFSTLEDATLANERLSSAMNQQWGVPQQRITDGKWWLEQPDSLEDKMSVDGDIVYTVEEFNLNWRIQESS